MAVGEKVTIAMNPLNLMVNKDAVKQLLPVPLSVYSYLQKLEKQSLEYHHYGLFKNSEFSLHQAQNCLVDELVAQLPASVRILIVGIELEFVLKQLVEKGYSVDGITPPEFENYMVTGECYQAIIFHESAYLLDSLVIFNQSFNLLSPSGVLIVLDEFVSSFAEPQLEKKHSLNDFLHLAQRFNFKLEVQNSLSPLIQRTFDILLQLLYKHEGSLINDLKVTRTQFQQYVCLNKEVKEKYQQQNYSYTLLYLKKMSPPRWWLKHFNKHHLDKMLSLFELSFNHQMSKDLWQWKYSSEKAREICVWEQDELIAHYGGLPRDILFFGQAKTAVQIGDVMVKSDRRGILTRNGPFFRMTASFMECYTGYGKPFIISFGFPNERHIKLGKHLGLYAEVGRMTALSWSALVPRPRLMTSLKVIDHANIDRYKTHIDQLWVQMAQYLTHAIVGVRDSDYLIARYLNHPEQSYQVIFIKQRWTAQPIGILVLQYKGDQCDMIDVVAPLSSFPLIILHARRLAAINHCQRLYCQITQAFSHYFAVADYQRESGTIPVASDIWSNGPSSEDLTGRWWLMAGDMDSR